MRNAVLATGLFLLVPLTLLGQSRDPYPAPKAEFYGGFSYIHLEQTDLTGWNISLAGNVNNNVGIVGEASGHYNRESSSTAAGTTDSKLNFHTFMAGPRITERRYKWISPFVHGLFGFTRVNAELSQTEEGAPTVSSQNDVSGFTMALGGGLDITTDDRFFIRLIQADYFLIRADRVKHEGARVSAGLVVRFGRRETF
jgi:opacity protein-like surface antigen